MKPFKIRRNSWHFRLAKRASFDRFDSQDICTYLRHVVGGAMLTVIACAVAAVVIAGVVALVYTTWAALAWALGLAAFGEATQAGLIVWCILFTIAACFGLTYLAKRRRPAKEAEPGFIALAYRSVKDKTCAKIELE